MVVLGVGRGGHHAGSGHGTHGPDSQGHAVLPHADHAHADLPHVGPGHAAGGHVPVSHGSSGHATGTHFSLRDALKREGRGLRLTALLSPRLWFSILLGFGASGILLEKLLPHGLPLLAGAVVGAVLWERLLVTPVFNLCLGFASRPARTLESAVAEEAVAVTRFDADGCGLISLVLDGHEFRLLGRLSPSDRAAEREVHGGDRLFVESVDVKHNSCVVSVLDGIGPDFTPDSSE